MKTYNANCPCCGHRNNSLYLDETEGWMECEKCGELAQVSKYLKKRVKISVFRRENLFSFAGGGEYI